MTSGSGSSKGSWYSTGGIRESHLSTTTVIENSPSEWPYDPWKRRVCRPSANVTEYDPSRSPNASQRGIGIGAWRPSKVNFRLTGGIDMVEDLLTTGSEETLADPTSGCRRHSAMKPLLAAASWLAAAVGSLLIATIPYNAEESVCGVWGCYPPLQALAAMHLFWCVVIGAAIWSIREWRPGLLIPVGLALFVVSVPSTILIVGNDLHYWVKSLPDKHHPFWPRRIVYTLATLTDVPLLQSILAALVCIGLGRQKAKYAKSVTPLSCVVS